MAGIVGGDVGTGTFAGEILDYKPGPVTCLLYTSDAADERSSVDLGGRRIIKKKTMSSAGVRKTESHNSLVRALHLRGNVES